MAKKKIRTRRVPSSTPRMYGDGRPSVAAKGAGLAASAPQTQPGRSQMGMAEEYRYVLHDLRRLGILAATTFGILVVLGFVIR